MIIHDITVENFKSMYGKHYFNFDKCQGLIKLSGGIGSGKTSLAEAIIWGLFGTVKGQNNTNLISWNEKYCQVEITLTSKGKDVRIIRNIREPLIIEVNGKLLAASNKRDTQSILEEEIFDTPKLAITKMCIISFTQFNSLMNMNPNETKQFLDDIFEFKLFSEYNEQVMIERKNMQNELVKYQALFDGCTEQINELKEKQASQTLQLNESINIDSLNDRKEQLINEGLSFKNQKQQAISERDAKNKEYNKSIQQYVSKMSEVMTLGKQAKANYNKFKDGVCPTCGQKIEQSNIDHLKNEMQQYATMYKDAEKNKLELEAARDNLFVSYKSILADFDSKMDVLRKEISGIDSQIKSYNKSLGVINDNFEELINAQIEKQTHIKELLDKAGKDINEWNDMNILFTKTLRYNLLETLIPHINSSIKFFINKLNQPFNVVYDQEFKPHITIDMYNKEISYNNLSTGQKKTLDLAIIFGILRNLITNVNINIIFLDELFSNMDANTRNIMLSLLDETMDKKKTIFIVNHADMADDYFSHKIRVSLENKKLVQKIKGQTEEIIIKCSKYEQIF